MCICHTTKAAVKLHWPVPDAPPPGASADDGCAGGGLY